MAFNLIAFNAAPNFQQVSIVLKEKATDRVCTLTYKLDDVEHQRWEAIQKGVFPDLFYGVTVASTPVVAPAPAPVVEKEKEEDVLTISAKKK